MSWGQDLSRSIFKKLSRIFKITTIKWPFYWAPGFCWSEPVPGLVRNSEGKEWMTCLCPAMSGISAGLSQGHLPAFAHTGLAMEPGCGPGPALGCQPAHLHVVSPFGLSAGPPGNFNVNSAFTQTRTLIRIIVSIY